jgi:hypothetical protein
MSKAQNRANIGLLFKVSPLRINHKFLVENVDQKKVTWNLFLQDKV